MAIAGNPIPPNTIAMVQNPYPVGTVVRLTKTNEFAIIRKHTYLKGWQVFPELLMRG
jgi:hypothetical protein